VIDTIPSETMQALVRYHWRATFANSRM
jgi:hypothetical protein